MNLRFKSIGIEKFRSLQNAYIDLENQGIVLVKGINEYEDKATSNGSGKSSIFEAIIYALFEETSAGEKDVANRILNDGYVLDLKFSVDNDDYEIQRQQKNNKTSVLLYKNGEDISARNKTDTNKLIQQIIGINKSIFLDSVFLSQNVNTNLASLSPTARKERLEILTNTDYAINNFKTSLKDVQNEFEVMCVNSQMEINKLNGKKESNQHQLDEIQTKIMEIQTEIERLKQLGNIEEIEKEITVKEKETMIELNRMIEQIEQEIENKEQEIENIRQQGKDDIDEEIKTEDARQTKVMEYQNIQNEISKKEINLNFNQNHIKQLDEEIEKISNSDTCPTCGRKLENANEEHIKNKIAEINDIKLKDEKDIEILNTEIDELTKKLNIVKEEGQNISQKLQEIQERVQENQNKISVEESNRKELLNQRTYYYNEKSKCQNEIDELKNKKEQLLKTQISSLDDFIEMEKNIEKSIEAIEKDIDRFEKDYEENNEYVNVAKNCIQLVTKEFRTYLLQNSLQYLNKLLQTYSLQLFSNNSDVIRIIGDDTKLNIQLGNATYESLSGGEKTRVNIALLLAQKSLASIIGNISCNIIILDEILGYCDSQAEENVINLLTSELDNLESIYMVSHKEIQIGYDKQLIIRKDKNGLSNVINI